MSDSVEFTDKSVLITGGASGIGAGAAQALLRAGARVAIVDVDPAQLDVAHRALSELGEVVAVTADVSDEASVRSYVERTAQAFGAIDVFVNNAGIEGPVGPLVDVSVEDFDRVLAVNLRGSFLGLKHVLPLMTAQGWGSVINVSSVAGLSGSPGLAPYSASKHGMVALTKAAAAEVAASGVRVNSVHPAPVNTRMIQSIEGQRDPSGTGAARTAFLSRIPLGRYAETDDIANMILFLASEKSAFITGSQFRVDGGMGAST